MTFDSILVYVGLDLVGDGLMKLPFARTLRANWPQARIVWCAGKGPSVFASTLRPIVAGLIDETIESAGFGSHWREMFGRPLDGRAFDLVIAEHDLANLNGVGLITRLRAGGYAGRIIILADEVDAETEGEYLELNVDRIMVKPVLPSGLRASASPYPLLATTSGVPSFAKSSTAAPQPQPLCRSPYRSVSSVNRPRPSLTYSRLPLQPVTLLTTGHV
jgi:hypothetical protein